MKKKSFVLTLALFFALITISFANPTIKTDRSLEEKIKSELSKANINSTDGDVLQIRFMINERNEILVVSTNNKKLDATIKQALNYDKVEATNLKPFRVYIVPVVFESR